MTASLAIQFQKVGAPWPWQGVEHTHMLMPGALLPRSLAIGNSEQVRFTLYSVVVKTLRLTYDHWNHQHPNSIILCE